MIAVISVYKVANFPDGGGHFWVYMQYAQGLRRLGCDVYWLEQFRPPASGDSAQEAALLAPFFERMKRFGLEGKTLLYAKAGNEFRFVGCEWPDVERVLKRADLLLNFHYATSFTHVSGWSTTDWLKVTENGKTVLRENTKRVAFLEFAELPRHTPQPLELALYTDDRDAADLARLTQSGWRVRHSAEVAGSPDAYRSYVQRSRGEFSCAKASCMQFQNAWVSDRTLCYLASGKPVVVQHTGPSACLPNGEGMFRFTSLDDATAALDAINRDYGRHCRAARDLAEAQFDSQRVLEGVLNTTLAREMVP